LPEEKPDWADERHRKTIVDQRRFLWREDTVEMHAGWMGLVRGMAVLDVGCGLGYLGRTYWRFYGEGGSYVGIDLSDGLLKQAAEMSGEWAAGGSARFARADAGSLPFPDGTFDWTSCQTLLMHVEEPGRVLAEMMRVTRPGGLVTCSEPDNRLAMSSSCYSSLPDFTVQEDMLRMLVTRYWVEGRRKLGLGDWTIGPKLPLMMQKLGLKDIEIRVNDSVDFIQPPYDTPRMQCRMEQLRESLREAKKHARTWKRDPGQLEFRRCYFAGGGTEYTWRRYLKLLDRTGKEFLRSTPKQIRNGTYFHCPVLCSFFTIRGRKPVE
jgi:ubiquinone/menaquinone biosynthesis C-methylase UbiE